MNSTPSDASVTNRSETTTRDSRAERRPLLSHSTILILSGFLIGLVSSRITLDELRDTMMPVGIVGILAFVGLDHIRMRRKVHADAREQSFVEDRLARHVDRCTAGCEEDDWNDAEEAELSLETTQSAV